MPSQLKHSSIYDLTKFLCLALIALSGISTSFGQISAPHATPLQESFRGTFQQDQLETSKSHKKSSIPPSIVFAENEGGKKYATITPSYFRLFPQKEYLLNGIVVQKNLPHKATPAAYMQLVQSAWQGMDLNLLEAMSQRVEAQIKKNPDTPLLLIGSLRKAESLSTNRNAIRAGGNVQLPALINRVDAVYPQAAKKKHISGKALLQVTIDEEGNVEEITPKSGEANLVTAAMEAVQQWKYSPTLINGNPVPIIAPAVVVFTMKP
jgi:TonB family protein